MNRGQLPSEPLRRALRELAEADAAGVIAEAREKARVRAAKLLEDALVDELLDAASRTQAAVSEPEQASSDRAWWTYCVLSAEDADKVPSGLEGIEPGTTVEVLREGELAALVSAVPAEEYDDVRLREHLEDLAWVERTARRHEAVLEAALGQFTIVPLRLCTLYYDRQGVQRLLREHAESLRRTLEKVDGCAEWGVKVFGGGSLSDDLDEHAAEDQEPLTQRPGATYLANRQRERDRAERASELRASCVEEIHRRVSACARESATNPPQHPELHGRDLPMLLNGVYLVEHERTEELQQSVSDLQAEWEPKGFVIELTGPWPAYNFASGTAGVMP